jgi:SAM-dependent methyltransferase
VIKSGSGDQVVASEIVERFYPEAKIGGFSRVNGSLEFYARINALIKPTDRILDYGAGRGAQIDTEQVPWLRELKTFKGRVAHVEGCDVDQAVLENPYLDSAKVFDPDKPLPYPDESFDLIYCSWVFEHIDDPERVAGELLRVTKKGGHICALTPNKKGYIALAARLAGNANHVRYLNKIQPDRLDFDVFPTRYKLNTPAAIRKYFKGASQVVAYASSMQPAYHFNKPLIFSIFKMLHRLTPAPLHTALLIYIRK